MAEYKNLASTIRTTIGMKKEEPTLLTDKTVEKLGVPEEEILAIDEKTIITEIEPRFKLGPGGKLIMITDEKESD